MFQPPPPGFEHVYTIDPRTEEVVVTMQPTVPEPGYLRCVVCRRVDFVADVVAAPGWSLVLNDDDPINDAICEDCKAHPSLPAGLRR